MASPPGEVELYGQASLLLPTHMSKLKLFERTEDSLNRKCKIICTMGPSCWDVDKLVTLIDCGMNICRLNFSHGDHEAHGACVKRIREAAAQRPNKPVAILLDTKGPEIRTGFFRPEVEGKIHLKAGQDLKVVTDYSFKGDENCIAMSYDKLPQSVKVGSTILCADGSLVLKVKSLGPDYVITTVMNQCSIGERKNVNLPGVKVELPVLQDKDINDLVNFGIPQNVDFVAASFVQSRQDVEFIRETLGRAGKSIKIISKIENREGLKNFDDILDAGDGIMVARGDLGMEIPPEKVFLAQKIMIAKCNHKGKPVVTATQMLESMTGAPRPTRAEAGDVANAVLDGTDCVMLSGETAGGGYPVEAVTVMRKIVEEAEDALDYNGIFSATRWREVDYSHHMSQTEATCSSAVSTAHGVKAPQIICLSQEGHGASYISKYRPRAPIFAVTPNEKCLRQFNIMRGVVPVFAKPGQTITDIVDSAMEQAVKAKIVAAGDTIVTVHGQYDEIPFGAGRSNILEMVEAQGFERQNSEGREAAKDAEHLKRMTEPERVQSSVASYGQAKLRLPTHMGEMDMSEHTLDSASRKCKIICTMGPSCWDVDTLVDLMDSGMDICRLNFSHGDHEAHGATVKRIREAGAKRPLKHVGILLDTKGPEIRTGFFKEGGKIDLKVGQELKLVTDYDFKGDSTCFAVSYPKMPQSVKPGGTILCADGSLSLKVKSCGSDHVITEVMNSCSIGERKNCNLPGIKVDLPVLAEKDINDIVNFGIPQGVDFVAASFVQSKEDVLFIRKTITDASAEAGKRIKIISKIENEEGLNNFDEICGASDGIMVARGDLGMEIPPEKVFLAQKIMIAKCNLLGKPVVTATQMLESMTKAPRPTRAEAGDVANAVLDGTDCVMLSGETAGGDFPREAVTIMRRIVEEAESSIDFLSLYDQSRQNTLDLFGASLTQREAMAASAVKQSLDAECPLILVFTETGGTVRLVAKYRPHATVLAVCSNEETARGLAPLRGVISTVMPLDRSIDVLTLKACVHAKNLGLVKVGDNAVVCQEKREVGRTSKIVKIVSVV